MAEKDTLDLEAAWPSFYPDDLIIPPEDAIDTQGNSIG